MNVKQIQMNSYSANFKQKNTNAQFKDKPVSFGSGLWDDGSSDKIFQEYYSKGGTNVELLKFVGKIITVPIWGPFWCLKKVLKKGR